MIRSCGVLSSALGLRKSFSTSDVSQLPSPDILGPSGLRSAVSTLALNTAQRNTLLLEHARLDHASRSCSTWVAVGEPVANTSQLPSPHGGAMQEQYQQQTSASQSTQQQPPITPHPHIPFTGADFVRSVNKKVRQNYIRRRLVFYNFLFTFNQFHTFSFSQSYKKQQACKIDYTIFLWLIYQKMKAYSLDARLRRASLYSF